MDKFLKIFNKVDWLVAIGSLGAGLYLDNGWLLAGGVLGMGTAWYKPAERVKKVLEKKMLRKTPAPSDTHKVLAQDDFYQQMGVTEAPALAQEPVNQVRQFTRALKPGPVHLSASRHNVLKHEHLKLPTDQPVPTRWI